MINQLFLFLSAGSIMTLAMTQSLTSMTYQDCHGPLQSELACKELKQ